MTLCFNLMKHVSQRHVREKKIAICFGWLLCLPHHVFVFETEEVVSVNAGVHFCCYCHCPRLKLKCVLRLMPGLQAL